MKVNIVTTCKNNCGISIYSDYLFKALKKKINARIVENTETSFFQLAEKAKQADIVHIQFEPGAFGSFAMLKGTGIPQFFHSISHPKKALIVTTIHEMNESSINGIKSFFVHFFQKFINFFVVNNSDLIFVHSRQLEKFLKKKHENIVFLPHASILQKTLNKVVAKKHLNLQGKHVLTIFGFVEPRKQHEKIINILPELDESIVLIIAGQTVSSEKYVEHLKQLVKQKKLEHRVIFTGFVKEKDIPIIFSASDLMLFPYKDIYQSGALCNLALGFGKVILASNIQGFRELKQEFECIEIVKDNEWKQKITSLLNDKQKQNFLSKKAKNYCKENSWKKIAEKTIKTYEKLLKV